MIFNNIFRIILLYAVHLLGNVQIEKLGIKVHLNSPQTAESLAEAGFDEVVLATGIKPRQLDIPGIDHEKVKTYLQVLRDKEPVGQKVAVIGAGGIGFDVTRGDSLEVVSIPFNRIDLGAIEEKPLWEQERFMPILKLVLGALVIIVLIFFVVRPMLMKLIFPENNIADDEFDRFCAHLSTTE